MPRIASYRFGPIVVAVLIRDDYTTHAACGITHAAAVRRLFRGEG